MQKKWTAEHLAQALQWWAGGLSAGRIRQEFAKLGFSVTRNAVIGKLHRTRAPKRKPTDEMSRRVIHRKAKPVAPSIGALEFWLPRVTFGFQAVGGCKFIEGDPAVSGWFFCEAVVSRGSFCAAHAVSCYGKATTRPDFIQKRSKFGGGVRFSAPL